MAGKNTAVFGIYGSSAQAERAVDRITAMGFSSDDISVLFPDNQSTRELAHEKNTKAPEGTAAGVTTGGVVGGTLGLLVGIGALGIPGLGPFIAAGPIMASLAGLGVGGAVGGLIGALDTASQQNAHNIQRICAIQSIMRIRMRNYLCRCV